MPEQSGRQANLVCQRTKSIRYPCRSVCVRAAQIFSNKLAHFSMYCTMIIGLTLKKISMDLSVCLSCCSGRSVVSNCLEIISPINVLHEMTTRNDVKCTTRNDVVYMHTYKCTTRNDAQMTIGLTIEMWVFHDLILPSVAAAPVHAQKTLP